MTRFYISVSNFDKWAHQNKIEYFGNFEEGVLCDNFVVGTKRGVAFVYEHVRNEWTSDYYVEFVPAKNEKELALAWDKWYDFERKCVEEGA